MNKISSGGSFSSNFTAFSHTPLKAFLLGREQLTHDVMHSVYSTNTPNHLAA